MRIELTENGPAQEVLIDDAIGIALASTGFLDTRPVPGSRLWSLRPISKVGVVGVGGLQVRVHPKVPIDRVIHLLEHGRAGVRWRDELIEVQHAPDLLTAIVEVYERVCRTALRRGLLQGYRVVEEALPVVRGRIRETDQLRRRFGMPVPVEVCYDDFTVDVAENRWLRTATLIALRMPTLHRDLRHRLTRLDLLLADVTPARSAAGLERWLPNRLNSRLHDALHLAEVLVRAASFEARGDGVTVTGFVLDMAKVFEDFVCATLGAGLRRHGGTTSSQDPWFLDRAREVRMKPDLVWYRQPGAQSAVIDAKYKAEKPDGFPDADLYQMLAYCTALRLPVGHLVYAKGNEDGRRHHITGVDVAIHAHTLDLAEPPVALREQVNAIAQHIARAAV